MFTYSTVLQVVRNFSDNDFVNWASEQKIISNVNQLRLSSCYNLLKLFTQIDMMLYSSELTEHAEIQCRYDSIHSKFQLIILKTLLIQSINKKLNQHGILLKDF